MPMEETTRLCVLFIRIALKTLCNFLIFRWRSEDVFICQGARSAGHRWFIGGKPLFFRNLLELCPALTNL